jgi:CDP-4-dehydro-6-deoxyglucose reductase
MPTIWHEGIVLKTSLLAPDVRAFQVQIPAIESLDFQAGQFITLDLPIGEKRLQRWRSYSIASAPDGSNVLELCVVRSPDGLGSKYLFDEVSEGDQLKFKGPEGGFVLPETITQDLVFICTGTGIAPFRSMILDIKRRNIAHRGLHLIFGSRKENGLLYREEMEELSQSLSGFRYDAVLSRQADWPGWKGYVHQVYLQEYQTPRPDVAFYLCGWSNMIDQAVENLLLKLGYHRSQIHFELYG